MKVGESFSETVTCKCDKKVNSYSAEYEPDSHSGISISENGIITFKNFIPSSDLTYILICNL